MAVPPVLVIATVLTEADVPPGVLTQAFTWLASASAAGAAAISGRAVDAFGAHGDFAVAATAAPARP